MSTILHDNTNALLLRLLTLTKERRLLWKGDTDGWFSTSVHGRSICFRHLFYEATNQAGSDPRFFEFVMPGINRTFAFGTVGADLLFELLGAANLQFESVERQLEGIDFANALLDKIG